MIFFFSVFILLGSLFFIFFVSKRFSPVPYYPTNKKDLSLIIKSLDLKNSQTVTDLGAGDGIVILKAAYESYKKNLNTKFIAVDINPILILILQIRRIFHPNKKNIKIILGDFFIMNFSNLTSNPSTSLRTSISHLTFYIYISPWFLDKVSKKILADFPKARIVSYMYQIEGLKSKIKVIQGLNRLYIYD